MVTASALKKAKAGKENPQATARMKAMILYVQKLRLRLGRAVLDGNPGTNKEH